MWDDLGSQKNFPPYLFFKAYYGGSRKRGHRSWNISVLTGVHIEAPEIFPLPIGQFCTPPRNAISPYATRAIYFVFPGEHIFLRSKYVSIWRGAWWTRYNRHCSVETLSLSLLQMEYFLDIKIPILNIIIGCKRKKDILFEFKLIII